MVPIETIDMSISDKRKEYEEQDTKRKRKEKLIQLEKIGETTRRNSERSRTNC